MSRSAMTRKWCVYSAASLIIPSNNMACSGTRGERSGPRLAAARQRCSVAQESNGHAIDSSVRREQRALEEVEGTR